MTRRQVCGDHTIRIALRRLSRCCAQPLLLVESMPGGFVRPNCAGCGNWESVSFEEIRRLDLWVQCPSCLARMRPAMVPGVSSRPNNYGYSCACGVYIWLADLLPHWAANPADESGRKLLGAAG